MFNFLEWLVREKGVKTGQNSRLADTFHLQDKDWNKYWKEWTQLYK